MILYTQPEYKPEIIQLLKVTDVPLENTGGSVLEKEPTTANNSVENIVYNPLLNHPHRSSALFKP